MTINFDNALGIHDEALRFRSQRSEVLANNLANADTPGFKARDIQFESLLNQAQDGLAMEVSHADHFRGDGATANGGPEMLYRNPTQPSIDGNTVNSQAETARFMQNSMDFQSSFQFLNGNIQGLKKAITGE